MPIKDASYANLARYTNAEVRRLRHYYDIQPEVLEQLLGRPEQTKSKPVKPAQTS
jgi:hypothetical protein